MDDDYKIKAPDVGSAFDRAQKGAEKEKKTKKDKLTLDLKPPVPAPRGMGAAPDQVSPQLRSEERKQELARTLLKPEFNQKARDAIER